MVIPVVLDSPCYTFALFLTINVMHGPFRMSRKDDENSNVCQIELNIYNKLAEK
jgi:hypothetical protein